VLPVEISFGVETRVFLQTRNKKKLCGRSLVARVSRGCAPAAQSLKAHM
jgi:hypothetical protein